MLVGELRSFEKPAIILEAERISRQAHEVRDTVRSRFERVGEMPHPPMGSWLDRAASLGLTMVLAVVLLMAVTALAQAGNFMPSSSLAQLPVSAVTAQQ